MFQTSYGGGGWPSCRPGWNAITRGGGARQQNAAATAWQVEAALPQLPEVMLVGAEITCPGDVLRLNEVVLNL